MTNALNQLSATEAAARIAAGKLKSEALVAACIERIHQREHEVQAWADFDAELALAQARARDKETPRTRLHGIPVGVKDVIDTADLPTEYRLAYYRGNRPASDAACVAQYASWEASSWARPYDDSLQRHPNKTRNPHNIDHTPGGSLPVAAAVADCMVPVAFGTQTSSSIIRPAAYGGTVSYKPTVNCVNRAGMKPLSDSLDTIGVLACTVPDAALIVEELSGSPAAPFDEITISKPRIGFCRTPYWTKADRARRPRLKARRRVSPRPERGSPRWRSTASSPISLKRRSA